ncbi:hypothetical protein FB561_3496 [Kribbella amoyensis]|uniref:Uncharacterized protein n=1 Tax=Kribbella amoyensis TaxID=996641 RepID=A0A561BU15_9ACTN|nr:hypothetical protein [Kribbella amoyensis]TWD82366.1 hypothetical protein FB561_3496 [Kribbella amoyensis]
MSEQAPVQTFVVGVDQDGLVRRRAVVRRRLRIGAFVSGGIGAVGIVVALVALIAFWGSGLWPFSLLLILSMVPLVLSAVLAFRLVADRERWFTANGVQPLAMRMSPKGLELAIDGAAYPVSLPWSAVRGFQQLKIFGEYVLDLRLQPGIAATTAGVRGLDQPAVRAVVKPSPLLRPVGMFPVTALDQPVHVIDQALKHLADGKASILR